MSGGLLTRLVERCHEPIDAALLDRARRHVLDWAGCVLGAAREPLAVTLRPAVRSTAGHVPSLGAGRGRWDRAMQYATALGNVLEMDDLLRAALVHPGPIVVPTALFLGWRQDATYEQVLSAIVRGYDVAACLGESLDAHHYRFWHPTATVGGAAAAATAAAILMLDADQECHAIANALSVSGGLWHMRHHPVCTKQWHSIHAVQTGIHSAEMARLGFTGSAEIVEGPQGWHEAMTVQPNPEAFDRQRPRALWTVSFKPWPACRHCHPAIDAALVVHQALAGQSFTSVDIETYADALRFCDNAQPTTALAARFSLQHGVAVVLQTGHLSLADFETARRTDPAVRSLRENISVASSAAFDTLYPQHFGARGQGTHSLGSDAGTFGSRCDGRSGVAIDPKPAAAKIHGLVRVGRWPG